MDLSNNSILSKGDETKENGHHFADINLCSICLDSVILTNSPSDHGLCSSALRCGHVFHFRCLQKYSTFTPKNQRSQWVKCPICSQLSKKPIQKMIFEEIAIPGAAAQKNPQVELLQTAKLISIQLKGINDLLSQRLPEQSFYVDMKCFFESTANRFNNMLDWIITNLRYALIHHPVATWLGLFITWCFIIVHKNYMPPCTLSDNTRGLYDQKTSTCIRNPNSPPPQKIEEPNKHEILTLFVLALFMILFLGVLCLYGLRYFLSPIIPAIIRFGYLIGIFISESFIVRICSIFE